MVFTITFIPPPYHDEAVELEADTAEEAKGTTRKLVTFPDADVQSTNFYPAIN